MVVHMTLHALERALTRFISAHLVGVVHGSRDYRRELSVDFLLSLIDMVFHVPCEVGEEGLVGIQLVAEEAEPPNSVAFLPATRLNGGVKFLKQVRPRFCKALKNVVDSSLEHFLPSRSKVLVYWLSKLSIEIAMSCSATEHPLSANGRLVGSPVRRVEMSARVSNSQTQKERLRIACDGYTVVLNWERQSSYRSAYQNKPPSAGRRPHPVADGMACAAAESTAGLNLSNSWSSRF